MFHLLRILPDKVRHTLPMSTVMFTGRLRPVNMHGRQEMTPVFTAVLDALVTSIAREHGCHFGHTYSRAVDTAREHGP